MVNDLVCGMQVDKQNPQTPRFEYNGRMYYFCTPLCRVQFEADPEHYKKNSKKLIPKRSINAALTLMQNDLTQKIRKCNSRIVGIYDFIETPMEMVFSGWRKELMQEVEGRVLEMGVGTGKNLQ